MKLFFHPENERMGARAVCILHKKISGITVEPVETLAHGRLLLDAYGCDAEIYPFEGTVLYDLLYYGFGYVDGDGKAHALSA